MHVQSVCECKAGREPRKERRKNAAVGRIPRTPPALGEPTQGGWTNGQRKTTAAAAKREADLARRQREKEKEKERDGTRLSRERRDVEAAGPTSGREENGPPKHPGGRGHQLPRKHTSIDQGSNRNETQGEAK